MHSYLCKIRNEEYITWQVEYCKKDKQPTEIEIPKKIGLLLLRIEIVETQLFRSTDIAKSIAMLNKATLLGRWVSQNDVKVNFKMGEMATNYQQAHQCHVNVNVHLPKCSFQRVTFDSYTCSLCLSLAIAPTIIIIQKPLPLLPYFSPCRNVREFMFKNTQFFNYPCVCQSLFRISLCLQLFFRELYAVHCDLP